MAIYTVKQGDCLSSIATEHGFADWRTIYNHADNAEFRRLRPNPNLIYPGDQLTIPDTENKHEDCPTDAWHDFKIEGQKTFARVRILKGDFSAQEGSAYKLEVDGDAKEGTLGGDGIIEKEISSSAREGTLTVWLGGDKSKPGIIWTLRFGELDPVEETTGVQARLKNLGFDPGDVNGTENDKTKAATKAFQGRMGLTQNGTADATTKSKLKETHDGA